MPVLPSGTVTFFFTDIEGSTPLWERHPEAMKLALARHNTILRQAIESHHGYVFKIIGDSFQAAFAYAIEALAAALNAQLALAQEIWNETGPLRVRMGLHTGPGEPIEHDYISNHTLNRVARVMSAAYGDQILLSQETADLVRRDLPSGVSLKDLGDHRLKGLSHLEHLFQVAAPYLRQDFPLLSTRIERPNNLPPQLTSFVGRTAEIAAVCEKLLQPDVRLLTLTGVGGTGKTRLSLQVGLQLLESFPDGVFFVPLASVREDHLVIPSIAEALGLRESSDYAPFDLLKEHLAHKQLLLILDNFEQILEAGLKLNELLAAAPRLKILVTSRTLLRLAAEHDHPVSSLSLPDIRAGISLGKIEENESVQLFVQRARIVKSDFRLTAENAAAVAEICLRLDGLPLAIELAAARCRLFTPQKMLSQLGSRLQLLVGGARDLPERHQTIRAAIDWSYKLLSFEEQVLFRRLAVFAAGCFLEAVEAVCSFDGIDVIGGLEGLLDKNLIRQSEVKGEPRFWMYETIREYALDILDAAGESDLIRQRHARYYIVFMHRFSQDLKRLETELDNIRTILRWSIDSGRAELGYRLTQDFLFWGDRVSEGRLWLVELLALPCPPRNLTYRGYSVFCAGLLAIFQGDFLAGRLALEEVESIAESLSYKPLHHVAQYGTGYILLAEDHLIEALELFLDLEKMVDAYSEWYLFAYVHFAMGSIQLILEEYHKSQEYLQSALEIYERHNRPLGMVECIVKSGFIALVQNDFPKASTLFSDGLQHAHKLGFYRPIVSCIRGFAGIALRTGDLDRSTRLFGSAEALVKITGVRIGSIDEKTINEKNIITLRAQVAQETFMASWQEGMQMNLEEVIVYALEGTQDEVDSEN